MTVLPTARLRCLRMRSGTSGAALRAGLTLSRAEQRWLTRLSEQAEQLPEDEDSFIDEVVSQIDRRKVHLDQYNLTAVR